jgi:hypothetical protein
MQRELEEAEEELLLREMSQEERLAYLRDKEEKKRLAQQQAEEEKRRREEEANRALNEVKRLAAEEAKRKAELERRMTFMQSIREEAPKLEASQSVNRAFVYSYFELVDSLAHKLDTIKTNNSESHINQVLGVNTDTNDLTDVSAKFMNFAGNQNHADSEKKAK